MSPAVIRFDPSAAQDPPVVPPNFFFGIWAAITIGCAAAALWGLPPSRSARAPYRQGQIPVSVVQLEPEGHGSGGGPREGRAGGGRGFCSLFRGSGGGVFQFFRAAGGGRGGPG